MDGWSATSHLKADPQTAAIPIIALTAHAMVGDRDQALAAGCDDYDTKPVDIRRLLTKVEALLVQHDPSQDQQIPVAATLPTPIPSSFSTTIEKMQCQRPLQRCLFSPLSLSPQRAIKS
jgi:DNA-binding response OmpR family regulator